MEAQHTPGRLEVAVQIFDNDGAPESVIQGMGGAASVAVALDFGANNPGMREANARRLAACWNFCDGIPTEKLEGTDLAGYVSAQTMLTGMQFGNGSATIELEGGACGLLAASFADQFKRSGAVNFLELQMGHPDLGEFVVSMQRLQGKTPAQLKAEAERQRDELLEVLQAIVAEDDEAIKELRRFGLPTNFETDASRLTERARAAIAKIGGAA